MSRSAFFKGVYRHKLLQVMVSFIMLFGLPVLTANAQSQRPDVSAESRNGDPENARQEVEKIEAEATIEDLFGLVYAAKFDLGSVNSRSVYNIECTIRNPFSRSFKIGSIKSTCSCIKPELQSLTIPPNGATKLRWRLETNSPSDRRDKLTKVQSQLRLMPKEKGDRHVDVRFSFTYRSALEFLERMSLISMPSSGESEFRIPIVYTDPVTVDSLSVTTDESLADIEFDVVESDDGRYVRGLVDSEDISGSSQRGAVMLNCEATHQTRRTMCIITRKAELEVSPKRFFLQAQAEQSQVPEKPFAVTAMLRLSSAGSTDEAPVIDALLADAPLPVSVKKLGGGIFRVRFQISREQLADAIDISQDPSATKRASLPVTWNVKTTEKAIQSKTLLIVNGAVLGSLRP